MKTLRIMLLIAAAAASFVAQAAETDRACDAFFTIMTRALPTAKDVENEAEDDARDTVRFLSRMIKQDFEASTTAPRALGERLAITDHSDGFKIRFSSGTKKAERDKPSAEQLQILQAEAIKLYDALTEHARKSTQVDRRTVVFQLKDLEDIDRALNVAGRRLEKIKKIDPEDNENLGFCTAMSGLGSVAVGLGFAIIESPIHKWRIAERNERTTQRNQDQVWEEAKKHFVWNREEHLRWIREGLQDRVSQTVLEEEVASHTRYLDLRDLFKVPTSYGAHHKDYLRMEAKEGAMAELATPMYPNDKQSLDRAAARQLESPHNRSERFTSEVLDLYNKANPRETVSDEEATTRGLAIAVPLALATFSGGAWLCTGKAKTYVTKIKRMVQRTGSRSRHPQHEDVDTIRQLVKAAKASPPRQKSGDVNAVYWFSATNRRGRSSHLILEIDPLPTYAGKKDSARITLSGVEYHSATPYYQHRPKASAAEAPAPEVWRKMEEHFIAENFPTAKQNALVGIETLFERAETLGLKGLELSAFETSLHHLTSPQDLAAPQALLERFAFQRKTDSPPSKAPTKK